PHDRQGDRPRCEQYVDDISERYVVVARPFTGTPAHVHANVLGRDVAGGGVERRDVLSHDRAKLRYGEVGKPGTAQGQVRAVELEHETGLDDGLVFSLHHLCHGFQVRFSGRVIAVGEKVDDGARRHGGHEHLLYRETYSRFLQVHDVLLDGCKIL